jgi:plastocyanin
MKWCLLMGILWFAACGKEPSGSVKLRLDFAPEKAPGRVLNMDAEEGCEKLHTAPVLEDADHFAFVYIEKGLEGREFPAVETRVEIDQRGCMFVPRVTGVRVGQTIAVKNSDPVSHSIHPMPKNNREWNQQQTPGAVPLERKFGFPEVIIPVKCNIHAWMKAYIAVMEHPFFAVLSREQQEVVWQGLPAGEYTVAVWHELKGTRRLPFAVKPDATSALSIDVD